MSLHSEPRVSSVAPRTPAYPLRLCRGWVAGCMDQPGITFAHRRRPSDCCLNGERAWLLADEQSFLGAFFDLGVARHIRDAATRYASLQQVDTLLARCSEEQPTRVDVGLFRAEEFEHLITLDRATALELLLSLLESLEDSMKAERTRSRGLTARYDAPASELGERPAPARPLSVAERRPGGWRGRCSNIQTHRMLQQPHRLTGRTRRIEHAVRVSLTRLELLFSDQCYGHSPEHFVTHLLAEVRHFCDAYTLDMAALDRCAYQTYLEELHGPTERELRPPAATSPALHVAASAWRDVSDHQDRSVLMATVLIGGVSHHLKAIQVTVQHGLQRAVAADAQEELSTLHAACAAQGPFETVRIESRDYVMTFTPHSR